jgi:tetratricopeptide (TPR) repeat protein
MKNIREFKQRLSTVSRLWDKQQYDAALAEVESLQQSWPGNGHLFVLWASLVQLQERPKNSLGEAKEALKQAMELDRSSPANAIDLGHFLDAVEDDPLAASKAFADGVALARQQMLEGLIGQAKALLQLNKEEEAIRCVQEMLRLLPLESSTKRNKSNVPHGARISQSHSADQKRSNGVITDQVRELLSEVFAGRPV